MKNKWRILKIIITVIILGFLLSFSLRRFSNKPLEHIYVNLKQSPVYFIDEKDIRDIVKSYTPSGRIGDVNIPALEKKISALPAVDSANVYMNLNGNLNLDIRQRVPVFRLSRGGKDFYVDKKGTEFPISKNYSHPCMLVTGNVAPSEYPKLAELVEKIDRDDFSKKYFIGIAKNGEDYSLLTSEGNYKVEIGDLDNIDFKVKGFKAFVEKYLVYQDPAKYKKISVKYDNQIVTTLNPYFKENDSIISESKKKIANAPAIARQKAVATAQSQTKPAPKKAEKPKISEKKKPAEPKKPKAEPKKPAAAKDKKQKAAEKPKARETKKPAPKPKGKVKVE